MKKFVHFRLYTEYSINKSIIKIEKIIHELKKDKQMSICICDENNIFNFPRFYKKCFENKIKPIIGCDMNFKFNSKIYKSIILIKNYKGYLNLCKIISKLNILNKNFLNFELFKGELKKQLILILNLNSFYYKKKQNFKKIENDLKKIKKYFKNKIYLEIQRNKNKNYERILKISNIFKIPLLATNPISFLKKKDFQIYKSKIFINNKNLKKKLCSEHYFYNKKKIKKIFENLNFALKNTYELSKRCNLFLNFNKFKLPFFKLKKKKNNNLYFFKLLIKKLKKRKFKNFKIYKKRLISELKVIINMKLVDYFLIVKDFINWSKRNKIQVGPGRGSSAGSLVSFLLNITEINPLKYDLFFERFLNIEKISIPDFDVDFCQIDREKVIKYIKKKYGICFISQIITFNRMNLKAIIKDVGKFLNFNYDFINEINKLISLNQNIKILEIIKKNKLFYNRYKNNKKFKKLIKFSNKLEGLLKNTGVHAGGIIISPNKNFFYFPLFLQNNIIIDSYFKDDLENLGILKFDFLGLATLSIIKNCLKNINKKINFKKISLKDKICFEELKKSNTIGVFQLESFGIRKVLKFLKPDNFKNIIAIISLYRPGPMKLINDFCLRKLGKKKVVYLDNRLKNILKETYGIIIYQEQIMQIARIFGKYSLNEADNLRRIISKKKIKEMENQKKIFIENSIKNGINYEKSVFVFNLIREFANYGFNKSHAAAYSLLSYKTIWLKSYYKEYFMSSNMSYYFYDLERLKIIIKDLKKNNIYILPLNINLSDKNFLTVENKKNKKIRYGFKGILGLGFSTIKSIIKCRKKKPFKNFLDFYKRINKRLINYRSIEILIIAGAFDSLNYNRANLIKKLIILSKINLKNKLKNNCLIKNIYFKKNYFWKFKIKILEEIKVFGFFFLNNIYNIYKTFVKFFTNINYFEKGVIIDIKEKIINNNFLIRIFNDKFFEFNIRINEKLFKENLKIIKKYNLIIFNKKIINNIIYVKNIINLKNC